MDTSIEHDHERFGGFLKISVEELIIALRDDRDMLYEAERVFGVDSARGGRPRPVREDKAADATLYPKGFTFGTFVDVIESERVWERPAPREYQNPWGQSSRHRRLERPNADPERLCGFPTEDGFAV